MLIHISLPKDPEEFSPETRLTGCCFLLYFFPFFSICWKLVHVALLVWPLWSKNISKCSLLADNRHKNFGPVRKVMEVFFFFLLPAQQSLLKITFIYYC